jgi:uncharacterized lipoprotein YddW (UPF0748 family)/N-acetylmuramoyl-L-alanine amidase
MHSPAKIYMSGTALTALMLVLIMLFSSMAGSTLPGAELTYTTGGGNDSEYRLQAVTTSVKSSEADAVDAVQNPEPEMRGIWIATVTNINYPSKPGLKQEQLKAELDDIVATAKKANLNAIFFQVRPACDALYKSKIFPASRYVSGTCGKAADGDFDSLAYLIEIAHENGMEVHAWVNPLRVTTGTADSPNQNVKDLPESSPARQHPEWVVPYADGKLYFDAGYPGVRKLVADGVKEIAANYDVDGIVFDDYFYPYPQTKDGAIVDFNDSASYKLYGNGGYKNDWRRGNINQMMLDCYNAIKSVNKDCEFGVAPFGIWKNDDGSNGGSKTNGLSSYSAIYADSLAWINGGYVDYLAPQIYWRFSTAVAPFDELTRWWNKNIEGKKTLDGRQIKYYISHAAYRYVDWENPEGEMAAQVTYARSELCYRGSVMYGYAALKANTCGLADEIAEVFAEKIEYTEPVSNGVKMACAEPYYGAVVQGDNTFIVGCSDPSKPLYWYAGDDSGMKNTVSRTKSGYFNLYVPLQKGKNTFTFVNGDESYTHVVYGYTKGTTTTVTDKPVYSDSAKPYSCTPSYNIIRSGGESIPLTCRAPAGATVKVKLGDTTVTLKQSGSDKYSKTDSGYLTALYTGSIKLPKASAGKAKDLGRLVFTCSLTSETTTGARVRVLGDGAYITIETVNDDAELKVATDSWYYDDYSVQVPGMRDRVVWQGNGYYKLRMGGYVACSDAREISDDVPLAKIGGVYVVPLDDTVEVHIKSTQNVPINGTLSGNMFVFSLFNVETAAAPECAYADNLMFSGISSYVATSRPDCIRVTLKMRNSANYYGYDVRYDSGEVVLILRSPLGTSGDAEKPLAGRKIILDAGHGGSEHGSTGALVSADAEWNEAEINLAIVLKAKEKLEALGAEVLLTRSDDSRVTIDERMAYLRKIEPDLCVSVHQNALAYQSNITLVNGVTGLWWSSTGKLAAEIVSNEVAKALNRPIFRIVSQRLAMCRNPRFPNMLVECGFITCVEEYEVMVHGDGIERAARGVTNGVLEFFKAQDNFKK